MIALGRGTTEHAHTLECGGAPYYVGHYHCVFCIRLNLADSEYSRQISGLDTRGISLSAYYNLANAGGAKPISVFAEMSSCLRVGPGLAIEVLQ